MCMGLCLVHAAGWAGFYKQHEGHYSGLHKVCTLITLPSIRRRNGHVCYNAPEHVYVGRDMSASKIKTHFSYIVTLTFVPWCQRRKRILNLISCCTAAEHTYIVGNVFIHTYNKIWAFLDWSFGQHQVPKISLMSLTNLWSVLFSKF